MKPRIRNLTMLAWAVGLSVALLAGPLKAQEKSSKAGILI